VPAPPSEAPLAAEVNPFIGEAHLDDQPLAVPVLSHDAITGGGTLRLLMTATPNCSIPSTHHRAASRTFANALFGAGCGEIQRSAVYAPRTNEFDKTIALPIFLSRMIGRLPSSNSFILRRRVASGMLSSGVVSTTRAWRISSLAGIDTKTSGHMDTSNSMPTPAGCAPTSGSPTID
jgi:hypothetical protein